MKTQLLIFTVALPLMALSFYAPMLAAERGPRAAISAQQEAFMSAMERGDAAAVANLFTADAKLSASGSNGVLSGRAAIETFWRGAVNAGIKVLTLATVDLEGEGSLRTETGTYTALGDGGVEFGRGNYLMVWKQEAGVWKIHRDFGISSTPPAASAPAPGAPAVDRVGFPRDYATQLRALGTTQTDPSSELTTAFANELAAAAAESEGGRFPNGSVIVMEFARPQKDGEDQLMRDAHGQPLKGEIVHVDVMRRGAGFGEVYGASRAGEWEFASYGPDGSTLIPPTRAQHCAACHQKAGADKDFVFRRRSWIPVR